MEIPIDFLVGIEKCSIGQSRVFFLCLSYIYSFEIPGKYTATIMEGMTKDHKAGFEAIAKISSSLP